MLAYVFWHRPGRGVDRERYEDALRAFHDSLPNVSASFRLDALPFGDGGGGYEDWYLVEDWTALGELNVAAVDEHHRGRHDAAAELAVHGWGGVYALIAGPAEPPAATRWQHERPADAGLGVWQRQMVLGPAPEYCLAEEDPAGRVPIAQPRSS